VTRRRAKNGVPLRWIVAHVSHTGETCLIWPFGYAGKGYASAVWVDGAPILACRYMCQAAHGAPPSDQHHAAHSCRNGQNGCIHPGHLRWATPAENEADKIMHGTKIIGTAQRGAKLDDEKVRSIRAASGTQQAIADRFGVSRNAVRQVLNGDTWSHVQ
jgi:hypothetical protein